jgi:EAL domain-containing protein (putative c-di-GMP-specific phosphodiesterase class I)
MSSGAMSRMSMDNALRHAIKKKELSLHYQPQVDVRGQILSVEALLRWDSPALGTIPPVEFIPLAEENGLILSIGQWVLDTACAQKKAWNDDGLCDRPMRIAVNISQRQFQQNGFVESLLETLAKYGITSAEIELEMTESILMHNTRDTLKKLDELKVRGFKISVDDFGTGYSSLAYLKHFPVDVLKIDQSFVRDIGSDVDDMAISLAIISMAKNLNLTVIAEGVETLEQLDFLQKNGCDAYQGFHFNPALPGDDITILLRARKKTK